MSLKSYGILKGRPIRRIIGQGSSPHYQIHMIDETTDYRIAVNVKSKGSPSELEYLVDDEFLHPITAGLVGLAPGFTSLQSQPGGLALDYIRGNLFDRTRMKPHPYNRPGPDNDLNDTFDRYVLRAMGEEAAVIYAFGERWGPEANQKDKYLVSSRGTASTIST